MERDELIVTLRRRGRTQAQIARRLGMTQQGVAKAHSRIAEGRSQRSGMAPAAAVVWCKTHGGSGEDVNSDAVCVVG